MAVRNASSVPLSSLLSSRMIALALFSSVSKRCTFAYVDSVMKGNSKRTCTVCVRERGVPVVQVRFQGQRGDGVPSLHTRVGAMVVVCNTAP